jgi:hypothetical protein
MSAVLERFYTDSLEFEPERWRRGHEWYGVVSTSTGSEESRRLTGKCAVSSREGSSQGDVS